MESQLSIHLVLRIPAILKTIHSAESPQMPVCFPSVSYGFVCFRLALFGGTKFQLLVEHFPAEGWALLVVGLLFKAFRKWGPNGPLIGYPSPILFIRAWVEMIKTFSWARILKKKSLTGHKSNTHMYLHKFAVAK